MRHEGPELARITLAKILPLLHLSPKELDLLIMRTVYDMYFDEIGVELGMKYRGKPYTEGAVRYKFKRMLRKIAMIVAKNNLK